MKQLTRKTLGLLLAFVMVLALLPGLTVTAQAVKLSYYLYGSVSNYTFNDDYLMQYDENREEMFLKGVRLDKGDTFKVASTIDGGTLYTIFPEGIDNAYTVAEDGTYDVYFRPDGQGGEGWYAGYIYVAPSAAPVAPLFGTYTLDIPSALTVANKGWNASAGISATGELPEGKTISVVATSGDEFALVNRLNNDKKIAYTLATATDAAETTTWTFEALSTEKQTLPMGVIVADYTNMPAGTYEDTVTFTVKVVDLAKPTLADALTNGATFAVTFEVHEDTYVASFTANAEGKLENPTLTKNGSPITLAESSSQKGYYVEAEHYNGFFNVIFYYHLDEGPHPDGTEYISFDVAENVHHYNKGISNITINGVDVTDSIPYAAYSGPGE